MLMNARTVRTSCITLALAAILGIAVPASAGDDLPFIGIAFAQITSATPGDDGVVVTIDAVGHATFLGTYTRMEEALVGAAGEVTGSVDFRAANGDHLTADIEGAFINQTDVAGDYIITGGTGRFQDAEGTVPFLAQSDDGIHYTVHFSGVIDF